MPHYRRSGSVPPKRHTDHRSADGRRYAEELIGRHGFSGESSLLYHRHSPSAVRDIRPVDDDTEVVSRIEMPLRPHHLRPADLPVTTADPVRGRQLLLRNADVSIAWVVADSDSPLTRSVVGDEIVYVQSGAAVFESVFGSLAVGAGDYVVVPSGVTHRWAAVDQIRAVVIAPTGAVSVPDRYLSPHGQFLEHSPFCERDLRAPEQPTVCDDDEVDVDVLVRSVGGASWHTHAHHPFDVDGWDGCVYPWALNIGDFEPLVGSIHQPPPVHQTFAAPGVVVCSFVPRPFDFHPDAIKVPYHHAHVDSDEVIFYSDGDFMSRKGSGIERESISFHPAGFVHGPQPGSVEASLDVERTEETAVMVDTFRPLEMTDAARTVSDPAYPSSWG